MDRRIQSRLTMLPSALQPRWPNTDVISENDRLVKESYTRLHRKFTVVVGADTPRSQCRMSLIRYDNVALANLRKGRVVLSILRKGCVALSILSSSSSSSSIFIDILMIYKIHVSYNKQGTF